MTEVRKTRWMEVSEELFLAEYEDPNDFYKKFGSPVSLYNELAKRVVGRTKSGSEMGVYRVMYDSYMDDQSNNNHEQLDRLVIVNNKIEETK